MKWLDYDVSVVPLSQLDLDAQAERSRWFATIAEGMDGRGSLGLLHDIAIEVALDSDDFVEVKDERHDAGLEDGLVTGRTQLEVLRGRVENDWRFKDIPEEIAAELIRDIDELYDEIEDKLKALDK